MGFSLVELLVVVAIMGGLASLAAPAFNAIIGGKATEKAITSVSGLIELARSEAMSRRSHVFVIFKNGVNPDNNAELHAIALFSLDGTENWNDDNIKPISKVLKVEGIKSTVFNDLPDAVKSIAPSDVKTGTYMAGWGGFKNYSYGGVSFAGAPYFRFTPEGEIARGSYYDSYNLMVDPKVSVGLAPTRGTEVQISANDGAIVTVYGNSSRLGIVRP